MWQLLSRVFQGAGEQPRQWCSSLRGFCLLTLRGGTSNRPLQDQSPPSYFIQMLNYNFKKLSLILFRYLFGVHLLPFASSSRPHCPCLNTGKKETAVGP